MTAEDKICENLYQQMVNLDVLTKFYTKKIKSLYGIYSKSFKYLLQNTFALTWFFRNKNHNDEVAFLNKKLYMLHLLKGVTISLLIYQLFMGGVLLVTFSSVRDLAVHFSP